MQKIILSADSTCDIGPDLASRFAVHLFPYHIQIGDKSYIDGIEITAEELGNIFVVDSASLSSGFGLLVAKAGEMIEAGLPAEQIFQNLVKMRHNTSASFVLDTLEFMRAGGRCSAVAAFGATVKECMRAWICIGLH